MGIFRFNDDQDKELLRELIVKKPFAAAYGETMQSWGSVAAALSQAIGVEVNTKQVRDRLGVLKKNLADGERRSAIGSGIEESLDANDVQSHYDEINGLVSEYVALESIHLQHKRTQADKKKRKTKNLNVCASEIMTESNRRRSQRNPADSEDDDDEREIVRLPASDTELEEGRSRLQTPPKTSPLKRTNAFVVESQRQAKMARASLDQQKQQFERQLSAQEQQHKDRMAFEREQAALQLAFQREQAHHRAEADAANRAMILTCARLFSDAFAKNTNN